MPVIPGDMTRGSSAGAWPAEFNATTGGGILVWINAAWTPRHRPRRTERWWGHGREVFDRAQHA